MQKFTRGYLYFRKPPNIDERPWEIRAFCRAEAAQRCNYYEREDGINVHAGLHTPQFTNTLPTGLSLLIVIWFISVFFLWGTPLMNQHSVLTQGWHNDTRVQRGIPMSIMGISCMITLVYKPFECRDYNPSLHRQVQDSLSTKPSERLLWEVLAFSNQSVAVCFAHGPHGLHCRGATGVSLDCCYNQRHQQIRECLQAWRIKRVAVELGTLGYQHILYQRLGTSSIVWEWTIHFAGIDNSSHTSDHLKQGYTVYGTLYTVYPIVNPKVYDSYPTAIIHDYSTICINPYCPIIC